MRTSLHKTLVLAGLLAVPASGAWAIGNALSFDATKSTYVQVARPVSDNFTIEFWVKTSMASPTGTLWYQGAGLVDGEMANVVNDFGVSLLNGKAAFGVGNPDVTIQSTTTINDGNWHHIAATRLKTSGLMLLYVDGVQEASSTGITTNVTSLLSASDMHLGSIQTGPAYFTGQLDEVRMWSTVRTPANINAYKNYLVPSGTTVKLPLEVVVPVELFTGPTTVIGPLVAPAGTVAVICPSEFTTKATAAPLISTELAFVKLLP